MKRGTGEEGESDFGFTILDLRLRPGAEVSSFPRRRESSSAWDVSVDSSATARCDAAVDSRLRGNDVGRFPSDR